MRFVEISQLQAIAFSTIFSLARRMAKVLHTSTTAHDIVFIRNEYFEIHCFGCVVNCYLPLTVVASINIYTYNICICIGVIVVVRM